MKLKTRMASLTRWPRLARRLRDESGVVLTEFAAVFLVWLVLILSIVQVSIWVFTLSATQFAVWDGCRRGAAVYQPAPPDGTVPGGLTSQLEVGLSEQAAGATFAAVDRIEDIMNWMPMTQDYSGLTASVVEEAVLPGEEGQREITAGVTVRMPIMVPIRNMFILGDDFLSVERICRLRLARYYAY